MKFDRKKFFDNYRKDFGSLNQSVVDAIEFLLSGFETTPEWNDIHTIAYALSTIFHETAHTFLPITEYGGESYFKKYDGRASLGNNKPGDGARFKGRGYVQITGRTNYTRFSKLLGVDLVKNPELTLKPEIAFSIMTLGMHKGYFTGKKLSDYINASKTDYKNARRIINGTDKAATLATYATKFEKILTNSVSTDTKQPAQTISTNLPEIPADSTAEPVEVPDTVLSSDETVPAITETTKTTEKETDEGTETVETKAEVQQTISIEKPAPKGFIAKIKAKIAGLFGGAVGMDVITEKAAQANTLGLSPDTWKRIFYVALFAALAYLIYELVDHIISMKRDKEITNELIKANTTDTNIVQLVDAEKLQALKAQGYEIVKR